MTGGTSLSDGRLCTPPIPWTSYLYADMLGAPECKGPVIIINTGKGSQTSDYGAAEAALMAPLKPTHVLMEDFGINDCAIGPVSIPQATANFNSMVASYRAANPNVVIIHQTMSPAAATDVNRTNLATYYTNGLTNAALNSVTSLDNYNGTAIVPGGWVKPLPNNLTVGYSALANAPAGFSFLSGNTINPADKSADITLLNGNLTGQRTSLGVAWVSARAVTSFNSGKYYFQTTPALVSSRVMVGIAQSGLSLANFCGSSATSWGYDSAGDIYNNNASIAVYPSYTTNDVIGIAVDLTNNKIWFRKNTGNWNNSGSANPATNVGGLAISAGTYFPTISIAGMSDRQTVAFGSAGDDLHPVWPSAFQTYSYPNILAAIKAAMAAWWP